MSANITNLAQSPVRVPVNPAFVGNSAVGNARPTSDVAPAQPVKNAVTQRLAEADAQTLAGSLAGAPALRTAAAAPSTEAQAGFMQDAAHGIAALADAVSGNKNPFSFIGSNNMAQLVKAAIETATDIRQSDRLREQTAQRVGAQASQAQAALIRRAGTEALAVSVSGATTSMALSAGGAAKSIKSINTQIKSVNHNVGGAIASRRAEHATLDGLNGRNRTNALPQTLDKSGTSSAKAGDRQQNADVDLKDHYRVELGKTAHDQRSEAERLDAAHTVVQNRTDIERAKVMVIDQSANAVNGVSNGVREQITSVSNAQSMLEGTYAQAAGSARDEARGAAGGVTSMIGELLALIRSTNESNQRVSAAVSQAIGH